MAPLIFELPPVGTEAGRLVEDDEEDDDHEIQQDSIEPTPSSDAPVGAHGGLIDTIEEEEMTSDLETETEGNASHKSGGAADRRVSWSAVKNKVRPRRSSSLASASASGFPTANGRGTKKRTESMASSTTSQGSSLREQIIDGLKGSDEWIVPGDEPEDVDWKYKKRVPTMVLYDEKGLRLYDRITEEAKEYYPFQAELEIFKRHGLEIAHAMGFPKRRGEEEDEQEKREKSPRAAASGANAGEEKWGDANVGRHNEGVNGEEGAVRGEGPVRPATSRSGQRAPRAWDVVELGAGSLRKTSVFLQALASTVEKSPTPKIRYHALDLSHPELKRTLAQLENANKETFEGKIDVGGLWGDYERGIDFMKHGGLDLMQEQEQEQELEVGEEAATPQPIVDMHSPILAANRSNSASPASIRATPKSGFMPPIRRASTSSLASFRLDGDSTNDEEEDTSNQLIRGVRHADLDLDAETWRTPAFKERMIEVLRAMKIPRWASPDITPANVHLLKISAACTNAVFFCSFNPSGEPTEPAMSPLLTPNVPGTDRLPSDKKPATLLVRVYGPSTGKLIERTEELRILHTLSDRYHIGPRLEGTFANGRIEQFFDSRALRADDLRQPTTSRSIAARMRELHSVDIKAVGFDEAQDLHVWKCLREWAGHAKDVVAKLKDVPELREFAAAVDFDRFEDEVEMYKQWVAEKSQVTPSRVFCHNDTQHGNILLLDRPLRPSEPEHHKLIVVDFEFAAPNPRGYDIANHFHEWQGDYLHPTHSWSMTAHKPYPTPSERENFYRGYLAVQMDSRDGRERIFDPSKIPSNQIVGLEREVRVWSPASSAFWALWGIVQANEQVEEVLQGKVAAEAGYDYMRYTLERINMFRDEAAKLGALPSLPTPPETAEQSRTASPPCEDRKAEEHPRHILFLGSSLGNFDRESAAPFLASLPLRAGTSDSLLLGLDGRPTANDEGRSKVETAYNDPQGHTRDFIMHGLDVMKTELQSVNTGKAVLSPEDFKYRSRYNVKLGRHEAYYQSLRDQVLPADEDHPQIEVAKDETLNIEWSYKYSMSESLELFDRAGLRVVTYWRDPNSEYRLFLLQRPPFHFPLRELPATESERWPTVPTRQEWQTLWAFWDSITLGMIPESLLHSKPIDLRHKCLFYLGHIPGFLDIHLTRLLGGKHTEPEHFKEIFERGIDPNVDDPTKVHNHSKVPEKDEDWPRLGEILDFRDRVRARLMRLYDDLDVGKQPFTRRVARTIVQMLEHEAMHAETLLFMLIQSPAMLPPPGFAMPNWDQLAARWDAAEEASVVLDVPASSVTLGHDDKESEDKQYMDRASWDGQQLGWDNENPACRFDVQAFRVESLPISNEQYSEYMRQNNVSALPESWTKEGDRILVKTLYGAVDMRVARQWPLKASYDEIAAYAKWRGGRLPTEAELVALWQHEQGPRPAEIGSNIGLRNWHPVPASNTRIDTCGRPLWGHNGGVWEWTSTVFEGHPGFEQADIYKDYSVDFFDGVHNVVVSH